MHRALVYVEGEATQGSYTDAEGNQKKALNIVQRTNSRAGYYMTTANGHHRSSGGAAPPGRRVW